MSNLLELTSSPGSVILHIEEILAQIAKEYSETTDPVKRNSLLNLHQASLNIVQARVAPEDLESFLENRSRHYWALLASETVDDEGLADAEELERVTAREIAAGRMSEDDKLRQLALQGAEAECAARQSDAPPTKAPNPVSLWHRFLSALTGR